MNAHTPVWFEVVLKVFPCISRLHGLFCSVFPDSVCSVVFMGSVSCLVVVVGICVFVNCISSHTSTVRVACITSLPVSAVTVSGCGPFGVMDGTWYVFDFALVVEIISLFSVQLRLCRSE